MVNEVSFGLKLFYNSYSFRPVFVRNDNQVGGYCMLVVSRQGRVLVERQSHNPLRFLSQGGPSTLHEYDVHNVRSHDDAYGSDLPGLSSPQPLDLQ